MRQDSDKIFMLVVLGEEDISCRCNSFNYHVRKKSNAAF